MPTDSSFAEWSRLAALRRALRELDPAFPPALRATWAPLAGELPRRLALLPGSFNPPTDAHFALAEAARRSGRVDALDYLLASRTINKERVEGAALADRLLLLEKLAAARPREGVVLVNRGLYVEHARILRAARPDLDELWFVVGYDKLVQIFDPRYYQDRQAALDDLFDLASFLVAPRAEAGADEVRALLAAPENRRYAGRVVELPLAPEYRDDSSSRVRAGLARGDPATEVPPLVARFVAATGAYGPPMPSANGDFVDRYVWRERALDLADEFAPSDFSNQQFAALLAWLIDLGPEGDAARAFVRDGHADRLFRDLNLERHA